MIGLSVLTRGTIDEQLRWIFTLYDINADGVITRDELNKIVNSVHDLMGKFAFNPNQAVALEGQQQRPGAMSQASNYSNNQQQGSQQAAIASNSIQLTSEEQAEQLFRKFDLNNDGVITLDEFLEACHQVSSQCFERGEGFSKNQSIQLTDHLPSTLFLLG